MIQRYCIDRAVHLVSSNSQFALLQATEWCKRKYITIHSDKTGVTLIKRNEFMGPFEVSDVINALKSGKSIGPNSIPIKLLKIISPYISFITNHQ